MNHKKLQLLVSSYLDSEVNESEKALVRLHLEECSECRKFIQQSQIIRNEISSLGEVKLANYFAERVAHSVDKRDEQTMEWLGIEPLARNTFIALAGFVLVLFFFADFNTSAASSMNYQFFKRITSNSVSTQVLLQQENLSKSDLLYAVMTK